MLVPRLYQVLACTLPILTSSAAIPTGPTAYAATLPDFFVTADGANYAYAYTPAQGTNATYFLLHGYPSTHEDWSLQVAALTAEGFGTLAPDMLGFGASDMPTEPTEYNAKRLAGHLSELLDYTNLTTVIGVGHDWGSVIMSRFAVYHKDRLDKLIWLSVGYQAPGGFLDLDAINAATAAKYGAMSYGYWYFFCRPDAASVIRDHVESHFHLVFPMNSTVWQAHLAPLGGARAWLEAGTQTKRPPFLDQAFKTRWLEWMRRPNAVDASLNAYRSHWYGVNDATEAKLTDEDWMLHVPVLAIGGALDPVARAESMEATEPWAKAGYESKVLDGGHWLFRELPEQVNELLVGFGRT